MPDDPSPPNRYEGMAAGIAAILAGQDPPGMTAKRQYSDEERAAMAKNGQAMDDGSFPIKDREDLEHAVQSIGRAKDPQAARAHIVKEHDGWTDEQATVALRHTIKRARQLGLLDLIPASWKADKTVALPSQEERATYCGIGVKVADAQPPAEHAEDAPDAARWLDWTNFKFHWTGDGDDDTLRATIAKDTGYTFVEQQLMTGRLLQAGYDRLAQAHKTLADELTRVKQGDGAAERRDAALTAFGEELVALKAAADPEERRKHAQSAHDHMIVALPGVYCTSTNLNPSDPDNDGDVDPPGQPDVDDVGGATKARTKAQTTGTTDATLAAFAAELAGVKAAAAQTRSELEGRVKDAELAKEQLAEEHAEARKALDAELIRVKADWTEREKALTDRQQQLDTALRTRLPNPLDRPSVATGQRPRVKTQLTTRDYMESA